VVNQINPSSVLKWTVRIVMAFFVINFISLNRHAFRHMDFKSVELSSDTPNELTPYQYVMEQTGNYKTDMMVYKYLNENYLLGFDYGESMFYQILVRLVQAKYFQYGRQPPIPQQEIIKDSTGTVEGLYAGSA